MNLGRPVPARGRVPAASFGVDSCRHPSGKSSPVRCRVGVAPGRARRAVRFLRGRPPGGETACQARPDALDDLPRRRLARPAAAVQGGPGVPEPEVRSPLAHRPRPGSDRLFVGEQAGVLYSFADKPDAKADLFFDLRKELKTIHLLPEAKEVEAVYGLAFHPDFEKNRQCFVCYTLQGRTPASANLAGRHARVAVHGHQDRPAADRPGERGDRPHLPARRAQRRRPPLRPRRHALHLHRRRRRARTRPTRSTPGRTSPTCSRPSCGSTWTARTRARTTPSRRTTRSSA